MPSLPHEAELHEGIAGRVHQLALVSGRARVALTHRNRGRLHAGQALVEFALVLPVLLVMTIGVVDLTRVFSSYLALTDGVRSAAVWAAEPSSPDRNFDKWCSDTPTIPCPPGSAGPPTHEFPDPDNIARKIQVSAPGLDPALVTLEVPVCPTGADPDAACNAASEKVRIEASYTVPLLTPILADILGGDVEVRATTTAHVFP